MPRPVSERDPGPLSQSDQLPLYNWAKAEFAAVEARNKCQDDAIHELGLQTSTAVATMSALVQEVRADRIGREASLVIAVRTVMREEADDKKNLENERFGRLSAEVRAPIETLQKYAEDQGNILQEQAIAIAGHVSREEFRKLSKIVGGHGIKIRRIQKAPGDKALKAMAALGGIVTTGVITINAPSIAEWIKSFFQHKGG